MSNERAHVLRSTWGTTGAARKLDTRTNTREDTHRRVVCKPKVAIVLNGNAKQVTDDLVRHVRALARDETLYVSRSLEQAKFIARHLVNQSYDVVLSGGGDGTFTHVVSDVLSLRPATPPAFGVLRLGTGNALARALETADSDLVGLAEDIRSASDSSRRTQMPLVCVEGRLAPFAGIGLDAHILQDYQKLQKTLRPTPFAELCKGMVGYGVSIASKSLWRCIGRRAPHITIRNAGAPARKIDLDGNAIGHPILRGDVSTADQQRSLPHQRFRTLVTVCVFSLRRINGVTDSSFALGIFQHWVCCPACRA